MSVEDRKKFTPARDDALQAMMVAEGVLQQYICYLTGTEVRRTFKADLAVSPLEFEDGAGKRWALGIAMVDRDYRFPLERFHAQVVVDAMNWVVKLAVPEVYKLMLATLDLSKPEMAVLRDSQIAWDPANTTAIVYSPLLRDTVRERDRRIGFVWL